MRQSEHVPLRLRLRAARRRHRDAHLASGVVLASVVDGRRVKCASPSAESAGAGEVLTSADGGGGALLGVAQRSSDLEDTSPRGQASECGAADAACVQLAREVEREIVQNGEAKTIKVAGCGSLLLAWPTAAAGTARADEFELEMYVVRRSRSRRGAAAR